MSNTQHTQYMTYTVRATKDDQSIGKAQDVKGNSAAEAATRYLISQPAVLSKLKSAGEKPMVYATPQMNPISINEYVFKGEYLSNLIRQAEEYLKVGHK